MSNENDVDKSGKDECIHGGNISPRKFKDPKDQKNDAIIWGSQVYDFEDFRSLPLNKHKDFKEESFDGP